MRSGGSAAFALALLLATVGPAYGIGLTIPAGLGTGGAPPPSCAPPALPLGKLAFTIAPGSALCGGPGLNPGPTAPFSGALLDATGTKLSDLGLGCLYLGDGNAVALAPANIPDGGTSVLEVNGISGLALTLASSNGSGPADCTRGAGPGMHCANESPGTDGMGACSSDADCNGVGGACAPDAHCFFGPPIPLPAGALSSCIVNVIAHDVCGSADLLTRTTTVSALLAPRLFLTSDNASPCPQCVNGTCTAGQRAGLACTGGVGSRLTSVECPPLDRQFIGRLSVGLSPLDTGTSTLNAAADGTFCAGQVTFGAFGKRRARTIVETGSPLLGSLGNPFATTLAGVFCAPATGAQLIDNLVALPGPAAVSVPGVASIRLF